MQSNNNINTLFHERLMITKFEIKIDGYSDSSADGKWNAIKNLVS